MGQRNIFFIAFVLSMVPQCTKSGDSSAKIVGGTLDTHHPEVKALLTDKVEAGVCTGVVVGSNAMLVAAHCLSKGSHDWGIKTERGATVDLAVAWNQVGGRTRLTERVAARDLAVLIFAGDPFAHERPASIAQGTVRPQKNDRVKLVGYGQTFLGNPPQGDAHTSSVNQIRNAGDNEIAGTRDDLLILEADLVPNRQGGYATKDNRAIAASGDSGSPLFNAQGALIGIGAAVATVDASGNPLPLVNLSEGHPRLNFDGAMRARNLFVDLASASSRKLLALAVYKGAKIPGYAPLPRGMVSPDDVKWLDEVAQVDSDRGDYLSIFFPFPFFGNLLGSGSASTPAAIRSAPIVRQSANNGFCGFLIFSCSAGGSPLQSIPFLRPSVGSQATASPAAVQAIPDYAKKPDIEPDPEPEDTIPTTAATQPPTTTPAKPEVTTAASQWTESAGTLPTYNYSTQPAAAATAPATPSANDALRSAVRGPLPISPAPATGD